MALAQFADEVGVCWPSQANLSTYTEQSPRTVREHLAGLEADGFLSRRGRAGKNGQQLSDLFRLNLERPGELKRKPTAVDLDELARASGFEHPPANLAAPPPGENLPAPRRNLPTPPAKFADEPVIEPVSKEEGEEAPPPKAKRAARKTKADPVEFDFEKGTFLGPIGDLFGRFREAFPAIDVDAEARRAALWLVANPANRKSNYTRFLTNWMSRAQDKAPRLNTPQTFRPSPTYGTRPTRPGRFDHADDFTSQAFGRRRQGGPEPDIVDV